MNPIILNHEYRETMTVSSVNILKRENITKLRSFISSFMIGIHFKYRQIDSFFLMLLFQWKILFLKSNYK